MRRQRSAGTLLHPGETIYEPMNRLTLRACGENRITITSIDGVVREFAPVDGDTSGRARLLRIATLDGLEMEKPDGKR